MNQFQNLDHLDRALASIDADADFVRFIRETARPALAFTRRSAPDADLPVGVSKLGGDPDLPPDMPWPTRGPYPDAAEQAKMLRGFRNLSRHLKALHRQYRATAAAVAEPGPLAFLCQIDLEAMSRVKGFDPLLPTEGRLLVFLDPIGWNEGAKPSSSIGFRVIWDRTPKAGLVRHTTPEAIARWEDFANSGIHKQPWATLPEASVLEPHPIIAVTHHWVDCYSPETPAWYRAIDAFSALRKQARDAVPEEFRGRWFGDQLGGWANDLQDHPENIAQLASSGIDTYSDRLPPEAEECLKRAPEWRHVLSISGEYRRGTRIVETASDDGQIYVLTREEDLEARRFEKAWVLKQIT